MYQPLQLKAVAQHIREELARPDGDPWLWIRQFLDDFYHAAPETRAAMIAERPELTGDCRFDAYLAALAEHLAVHDALPVPAWVEEPERFLEQWWFPTQFRSLHVNRPCAKPRLLPPPRDLCGSNRVPEVLAGGQRDDSGSIASISIYPETQILPKTRFMLEEIRGS
jgi:hypothetical protein